MHKDFCNLFGDYQRERGVGEVEAGKGGTSGDRSRLDLGW